MSKSEKKQTPNAPAKRRRVRKTGTLEEAFRLRWQAVVAADEVLRTGLTAGEHSTTLSACHALTQANAAFVKMQETVDLRAEVLALKEELREIKQSQGLRKAV